MRAGSSTVCEEVTFDDFDVVFKLLVEALFISGSSVSIYRRWEIALPQ